MLHGGALMLSPFPARPLHHWGGWRQSWPGAEGALPDCGELVEEKMDRVRSRESQFHDLVAHSVTRKLTKGMKSQLVHDLGTMILNGSRADVQKRSHFLVALTFCKQLNDLAFPPAEATALGLNHSLAAGIANITEEDIGCGACEETFPGPQWQ
jgi:hypothetical protein